MRARGPALGSQPPAMQGQELCALLVLAEAVGICGVGWGSLEQLDRLESGSGHQYPSHPPPLTSTPHCSPFCREIQQGFPHSLG